MSAMTRVRELYIYSQRGVKHLPRIQLIFFSAWCSYSCIEVFRGELKMIVIFVRLKAFTVIDNLSCMCCRRLLELQEHRN